jgi:hypothetical protein
MLYKIIFEDDFGDQIGEKEINVDYQLSVGDFIEGHIYEIDYEPFEINLKQLELREDGGMICVLWASTRLSKI